MGQSIGLSMAGALDPILENNQSQDISSPDRHHHEGESEGCYERKLLEALVDEIFSKKMGNGGSDSPQLEAKKRKRELEETVKWLRGVAVNPVDPTYVIREREQEVLEMRREMFLKLDGIANPEDLPKFASLVSTVMYFNRNPSCFGSPSFSWFSRSNHFVCFIYASIGQLDNTLIRILLFGFPHLVNCSSTTA